MVNGDKNSQVFISIRKLLLGDLESGAGLGPRVPDHWSCQIHTFQGRNDWHSRQEWLVPFCTWNSCNRDLLCVWVFSKDFPFLGWLLKLP